MNQTELKQEVTALLADIDKTHRYSMSKIYSLTNRVFDKNEIPQQCASCLIRKVKELRKWLSEQKEDINTPEITEPKKKRRKKTEQKNN